MFQLEGLDHIALAVPDVEAAAQWYIDVLGFERQHEGMWDGIPVFIGKGNTGIALFPPRGHATPEPHATRSGMLHFAWRADRKNFLAAQEELKRRGISFDFQDHEISQSIYFPDLNGYQLEITTYELK